jgi:hypothetical protein
MHSTSKSNGYYFVCERIFESVSEEILIILRPLQPAKTKGDWNVTKLTVVGGLFFGSLL